MDFKIDPNVIEQLYKAAEYIHDNVAVKLENEHGDEFVSIENKVGQSFLVRGKNCLNFVLGLCDFIVSARGNYEEYLLRAVTNKNLSILQEGNTKTDTLKKALEDIIMALNRPKGDKDPWVHHYHGKILNDLAYYNDNLSPDEKILGHREAIKNLFYAIRTYRANNLNKAKGKRDSDKDTEPKDIIPVSYYMELGLTWLYLADHLELEAKVKATKKSIKYQQKALDLEKGANYYFKLAGTKAFLLKTAYLDPSLSNPAKKEMLKREIITDLQISYNLNKDPKILDIIKEVQMFQI